MQHFLSVKFKKKKAIPVFLLTDKGEQLEKFNCETDLALITVF